MSGRRNGRRRLIGGALAVAGLAAGLGLAWAVAGRESGTSSRETAPSVTRLVLPGAPAGDPVAAPAPLPVLAAEPPTPGAALSLLLDALAGPDPAAAWPVLDATGRERFPSPAGWVQSVADRPRPLTFSLGPAVPDPGRPGTVVIEVAATHTASLDRFRGLVPARSVSAWRVHDEGGRWRVEPDPSSFSAVLPPDAGASEAARAWLGRLRACDPGGAAAFQVAPSLYGPADLPGRPCTERGDWSVGAPLPLHRVPDPSTYLAAFGPGAADWARVVLVAGPRTEFLTTLAPLGETWMVVGTAPA